MDKQRKLRLSKNSIRVKMLVGLLIILIPFIVFLISSSFYFINSLREKVSESNKNTLSLYAKFMDNNLKRTDGYLLNIIGNDSDYRTLNSSKDELQIYLASWSLMNKFQSNIKNQEMIDMLFLCNLQKGVYRNETSKNITYTEKVNISSKIEQLVKTQKSYTKLNWFPVKIGAKYYLIRMIGYENTYIGAVIDLEDVLLPLSEMSIRDNDIILYGTNDGVSLTKTNYLDQNKIKLNSNMNSYYLTGSPKKYMVIGERLQSGNINIVSVIPDKNILQGLDYIQVSIFVLSILSVLIIPISIIALRKTVIRPLDKMIATIEIINKGNFDAQIKDEYAPEEFKQVNGTFNLMIKQIRDLKIKNYEETINKQKAQLQYLQLQIKPHYFLNALKNLYGLAERKKNDTIQEAIIGLSNHFRYMFRDSFTTVSLSDELSHVKNYMLLQQIWMSTAPECEIDIDQRVMETKIPPLTIQTFVENSIKHGVQLDKSLKINIKAILLKGDEKDYVDVIVSDNGKGFRNESLEILNLCEIRNFDNNHIGLDNIKQRISLIYGEEGAVIFSNKPSGGAVSEIIVPTEVYTGGDHNEGAFDR